ncbi:MAG: SBBP repeat-containing protein [Chitinophagaceae bacterium]|nr:SBBP repeat-containing protein [Chitinophagaceae bacterium]
MNKLFIIVALSVLIPAIPLRGQTPKLTGAFNFSSGIAVDSKGNVFVTGRNNKIIKITPAGKAVLFAGGGRNYKDGKANQAGFYNTEGIAIDSADNLYVADGSRIRKISPDADVQTIAGTLTAEVRDGNRQTASFLQLGAIAVDRSGNIYVVDYAPGDDWRPGSIASTGFFLIRKISNNGIVTTLQNGNKGPLILQYPKGLACDQEGNLYVSASVSHCIKKIDETGIITAAAGQCDKTKFNSVYKEGDTRTAILTSPSGMAIAPNGDIYFSDTRLHLVIKLAGGKVSTVAGSGKFDFIGNPAGAAEPGYADGKSTRARFNAPAAIAFDRHGNLFIIDASNSVNSYIRKLAPDGTVTTFCKHEWNPQTSQYEEAN